MEREEAISIIKNLFPADAPYSNTAEIGQKLLEQAKREIMGWETEPTEVLVRYAQLCITEENRQIIMMERKKGEIK